MTVETKIVLTAYIVGVILGIWLHAMYVRDFKEDKK